MKHRSYRASSGFPFSFQPSFVAKNRLTSFKVQSRTYRKHGQRLLQEPQGLPAHYGGIHGVFSLWLCKSSVLSKCRSDMANANIDHVGYWCDGQRPRLEQFQA